MFIGLVKSEALTGLRHFNPFYFHHYNISYFNLRINGESKPYRPYHPVFPVKKEDNTYTQPKVTREYMSTLNAIGVGVSNYDVNFHINDFIHGKAIFAWDLSPDECNG